MYTENETIINSSITQIMQSAYIDYSMSVIISRALPDVRDGLKPVQRRVLYAMLREGLLHNRAFDKCAGVVGEVLKNYHPHGDSSVYDTLTRLAQDWVMRYPLVMPQGNFGSIEGDSPAAYRYTECKLAEIAEDLLMDIDSDTVDFMPNYKETATEPVVLPSALPTLLMNGSTGIAVGMTTNIPPHNLGEVIDGVVKMSKSKHNYIGITDSPDDMFGKVMSISDDLMWNWYDLLSLKSNAEIETLKKECTEGSRNPRDAKVLLAKEIIERFHMTEAAEKAEAEFNARFRGGQAPSDIPEVTVAAEGGEIGIMKLIKEAGMVPSNAEAGRNIDQGGVKLEGEKVSDRALKVKAGTYTVQVGKRRWARITVVVK